ncbi:hypothetical protein POTOM_059544 [Populus tomentosa]|uniref:Uncharacterized protein n=1 Tax=Populus tomentosa TaxID=118781 RepID=A0A8X8C367_POPTO|nr:hypothetical protein POTOM_059544 [Populus tomentosa]
MMNSHVLKPANRGKQFRWNPAIGIRFFLARRKKGFERRESLHHSLVQLKSQGISCTTLHALYSGCSALSLRLFAIRKDGTVNTFSNPIASVPCPECQGTCVNIEGDELEKTPTSHSEVFQYQMNVCNGYRGWMKSPGFLENCSTGFHFPPESGEPVQVF